MILNELITEFLTVKSRADNTLKAYSHDLLLLNRWFGDVHISSIRPKDLSGLLDLIQGKESSRLRILRTYGAFWNYLKEIYGVPNITKYIAKPKPAQITYSSISKLEVESLVKLARQDKPRNSFMVLLALHCGLRVGELKGLTLKQIDAEFIYDVIGKSKNTRSIPFPRELQKDAIRFLKWRQLLDLNPNSPLFPNKDGKPLNEKTIYRIINQVMLNAGIEKDRAHPHALRHTYAMAMLDHVGRVEQNPTKALTTVCRLMGHAYVSTTMKYIKPSNKELQEIVTHG